VQRAGKCARRRGAAKQRARSGRTPPARPARDAYGKDTAAGSTLMA
jgi:hypothetical protein